MGRKAVLKERLDNPEKKLAWVLELMPMFQKHGLRDFTMDQAAAYLNKSKATVYNYFESKEEIIDLLIEYKLENLGTFEEMLADTSFDYVERYLRSAEVLQKYLGDVSNILLADLRELYPTTWEKIREFQQYAANVLMKYYEEGIKIGVFHEVKIPVLVASDRFLFDTLSDAKFLDEYGLTIQEAFIEYFRMKFFGIVRRS